MEDKDKTTNFILEEINKMVYADKKTYTSADVITKRILGKDIAELSEENNERDSEESDSEESDISHLEANDTHTPSKTKRYSDKSSSSSKKSESTGRARFFTWYIVNGCLILLLCLIIDGNLGSPTIVIIDFFLGGLILTGVLWDEIFKKIHIEKLWWKG